MKKLIAALIIMGALIAPSYAKDKAPECISFATVFDEIGEYPDIITRTEGGGWATFWIYHKLDNVVMMIFDKNECWIGATVNLTIEDFINLGPINGRLYTSYEG